MGYNNNINNNNNMYNNNNNNEGGYEVKYKMEESIKELRRMKITMEQMVLHLASKNDSFSHRDRLKQERAKALSFLSSLSPLLQSPSRPDLDKLKHEITQAFFFFFFFFPLLSLPPPLPLSSPFSPLFSLPFFFLFLFFPFFFLFFLSFLLSLSSSSSSSLSSTYLFPSLPPYSFY